MVTEATGWSTPDDAIERAAHTSARLTQLGSASAPHEISSFCKSEGDGCSKFAVCDIHPQTLKSLAIQTIRETQPTAYEHLKQNGCLRVLVSENADTFRRALSTRSLAAGDFFGALEDSRTGRPAADLLAKHRCPYHGCVVPELAALETEVNASVGSDADAMLMFDRACPYSAFRDVPAGIPSPNSQRLQACFVTQTEFTQLQRDLGIALVSTLSVIPGSGDFFTEVHYGGKSPLAKYQFLAFDPLTLGESGVARSYPDEQVRLHMPRVARDTAAAEEEIGWHDVLRSETLRTLRSLANRDLLSPLEASLGIRYLPAGEIAFHQLLWLLAGENPESEPPDPAEARQIVLEAGLDAKNLAGLARMGLEVSSIIGPLTSSADSVIRTSSRIEDLELLGLRLAGQDEILTERAQALSAWLAGIQKELATPTPHATSTYSPWRLSRVFGLDQGVAGRPSELIPGILEPLASLLESPPVHWSLALLRLGDAVLRHADRTRLRESLAQDLLPAAPTVHVLVLAGITRGLDWLAVPLAPSVQLGTPARPVQVPQAALFVLATTRTPTHIATLVVALRLMVTSLALGDVASWVSHSLSRKAGMVALGAARLGELHELGEDQHLDFLSTPHARAALLEPLADADMIDNVSHALGRHISHARLASWDSGALAAIASNHWQMTWQPCNLRIDIIDPALSAAEPRSEGAELEVILDGDDEDRVLTLPLLATHAVYEALLDIKRYGETEAGTILVRWRPHGEDWLRLELFNPQRPLPESALADFAALRKRRATQWKRLKGFNVLALFAPLAGCRVEVLNDRRPDGNGVVGVFRIDFLRREQT